MDDFTVYCTDYIILSAKQESLYWFQWVRSGLDWPPANWPIAPVFSYSVCSQWKETGASHWENLAVHVCYFFLLWLGAVVQEQDSAAAQQYSRQGCPTGLRAELWALILNSTNQPQVRRALYTHAARGVRGWRLTLFVMKQAQLRHFPTRLFTVRLFSRSSFYLKSDVKTEPWAPVDLTSYCETLSFSPSAVYYSWLRFCPHVQTLR